MSNFLLDLPTELIVKILLYISPHDLVACQLTGKFLRCIVQTSLQLQYASALEVAGVENNLRSTLGLAEKLELLNAREEAWLHPAPNFTKDVRVNHVTSGIYDLTGGVYLLGNTSQRSVHYCVLPSSQSDTVDWKAIKVDRSLIDIGLAIEEHNLIAIITTMPLVNTQPHMNEIELQLLEFSTGLRHPLASKWRFPVAKLLLDRPSIGIEIVGDHLVLVLSSYNNHWRPYNAVFVYDWKTATQKIKFIAPYHSYSGLLFITPHIVVLPNTKTGHLEFWEIPQGPQRAPSQPRMCLSLPDVAEGRSYSTIACRGEPNSRGGPIRHSTEPFRASTEDTIIIFNLRVQPTQPAQLVQLAGRSFRFFVHRSSLLRAFQRHSGREPDALGKPPIVPWNDWGPLVTRWMPSELASGRWITTTAGQRACNDDLQNPEVFTIFDFNPYTVRKVAKQELEEPNDEDDEDDDDFPVKKEDVVSVNMRTVLKHYGSFSQEVYSSLPFVMSFLNVGDTSAFDGLLMDERRIIGLQSSPSGILREQLMNIRIFHFG